MLFAGGMMIQYEKCEKCDFSKGYRCTENEINNSELLKTMIYLDQLGGGIRRKCRECGEKTLITLTPLGCLRVWRDE